jgi:hypothetical protein
LLPQHSQISMLLAAQMMHAQETQAALTLLRPVAYSPHAGADSKEALSMIGALVGEPSSSLQAAGGAPANPNNSSPGPDAKSPP